jgi:phosphoribosylamine---glycine ligase
MKTDQGEKLKFLFVSKWGDMLDIAHAVQEEGHAVKFYIDYKPCREIGDGFVPKARQWEKHTEWANVIVFDYTGYGKKAAELRAAGKFVFGGTEYSDNLELDRSFGQDELKRHKIKILKYKEFTTFHDAIAYVEANPNTYVIKPCGETQDYKQLLFVGEEEDGSDIVRVLKAYEKSWGDEMGTFQLQRRVKGVEVSVAAFFNGREFIKPVNITFEHKKLFPKELGVSTGEMGTSMFWADDNPIFNATLGKMEKTLAEDNFVGHIDINCIVNGNGIYPLEFTTRFGFPQVFIQRAGIKEPFGRLLYKVASGQSFTLKTRSGFQVGAYMVVPPFPYNDPETFKLFSKDAVVIIKKDNLKGIHPMHLKQVNGEWLITGDSGIAVLISGTGTTMREAQKVMYSRISSVLINNAYYRTDIGDRWLVDSDRLWTWGLL